jgi:ABC-type transport system substrate-binding protein
MKEWVHDDHMVLVKNPFWFGWDLSDAGNIDEIYAVMVVEASTAYAMYLNDELDNVGAPQPESWGSTT